MSLYALHSVALFTLALPFLTLLSACSGPDFLVDFEEAWCAKEEFCLTGHADDGLVGHSCRQEARSFFGESCRWYEEAQAECLGDLMESACGERLPESCTGVCSQLAPSDLNLFLPSYHGWAWGLEPEQDQSREMELFGHYASDLLETAVWRVDMYITPGDPAYRQSVFWGSDPEAGLQIVGTSPDHGDSIHQFYTPIQVGTPSMRQGDRLDTIADGTLWTSTYLGRVTFWSDYYDSEVHCDELRLSDNDGDPTTNPLLDASYCIGNGFERIRFADSAIEWRVQWAEGD